MWCGVWWVVFDCVCVSGGVDAVVVETSSGTRDEGRGETLMM